MNKIFEKLASMSMTQVLGFGFVLGALYYFMVYDDGAAIDAKLPGLIQEIQAEEAKKKETEATLKEEANMRQSVSDLSLQYQEISKRLPSTLFSIDINRAIDAFSRNAGVRVKEKKPLPTVKHEIVDEIPVDIVLDGTYGELAQFVFYVSSAEKLTSIPRFVITQTDEKQRGGKLRFEGQVVGYKLGTDVGTGAKKE